MDATPAIAHPLAGLLHRLVAVFAGAAHLVLLVPFTVASGLMAPSGPL